MHTAGAGTAEAVLEVRDLSIDLLGRRGRSPVRIVRDVSFVVQAGEHVALLGESGAGKSVTARCVAGILAENRFRVAGSVRVGGVEFAGRSRNELRAHRGKVALVFQDPTRTLNPSMRVGRQIQEAVRRSGVPKEQATEEAVGLLRKVGIADPEHRYFNYPHELSGGMRQRIVIAIGLALKPDLLLADEATTSLDVTVQAQIMKLLRSVTEETGMAMVLITHDLALAASIADRIMVMYAGRLVEGLPGGMITKSAVMPYTKALVAAVPGMEEGILLPYPIPGSPPDPRHLPGGCAFHPRCQVAIERCSAEEPPYVEIGGDHHCACWLATGPEIAQGV